MKITYPSLVNSYLNYLEQYNEHYKDVTNSDSPSRIQQERQLHMLLMTSGEELLNELRQRGK